MKLAISLGGTHEPQAAYVMWQVNGIHVEAVGVLSRENPPGARLLQPNHRCTIAFSARQGPLSEFDCPLLSPLTVHLNSHEKGPFPPLHSLLPSTALPHPLGKLGRQILGCWWGLRPLQAHGQDLGSPVNDIKMVDHLLAAITVARRLTQPYLDWAAPGMRQWPRSQGSGRAFQKPLCSWYNP